MTKLSLVAALAVSAVFAGGDIAPVEPAVETPAPVVSNCTSCGTVTGTVKVWYGTNDGGANSLFSQNGAFGDAYADIKYSRKVMDNVTLNLGAAYLSTLGLENELVSGTWVSHGPAGVDDAAWLNEANVVVALPSISSFVKLGRQELDTPFFYSEKWNIATNTFDAAVVGNTSLPGTTLVAAWVGRGNGSATTVSVANTNFGGGHVAFIGNNPAYAFAAINKSLTDTTLQAWYYQIPSTAKAYWLQADAANIMGTGIEFGAQYAGTSTSIGAPDTSGWALKAGYDMSGLSLFAAYSQVSDDAGIAIANIATGIGSGANAGKSQSGQSKLYTEAYWNYGFVGAQNAKTYSLGAGYDLGMAKLAAQYTDVTGKTNAADLSEFSLDAQASLGPVDVDLAYVNAKVGTASSDNTVLVMLSMPFSL